MTDRTESFSDASTAGPKAATTPRRFYAALPALYLNNPFEATAITIEAMIRRGLPAFQITGLSSSRESADRIRSAIQAANEKPPGANIQINLAPVDLRKTGAYLDLSIAVSIMLAIGPPHPDSLLATFTQDTTRRTAYLGELSLNGQLRDVPRLPALLREARRLGFQQAVIPRAQISEARLIPGIRVTGIDRLGELSGPEYAVHNQTDRPRALQIRSVTPPPSPLFDQLQLDPRARRALAVAAAGWHSMVLIGPPGMGKTSLAREVVSFLPPPDADESIEILIGADVNLTGDGVHEVSRPMRAPHHSCTRAAMVGGGTPPGPGEITRAHHGVLLLDELAEFSRDTLQALREPMERGYVDLSRGREAARFPARFLLIATTNPCPCGQHRLGQCNCDAGAIRHYINRILGPLRDRIDLEVRVERPDPLDEQLTGAMLKDSVDQAIAAQSRRFRGLALTFNGEIPGADIEGLIPLRLAETREQWAAFVASRRHSRRSLAGIRRLARTIADLEAVEEIRITDLQEALYYRCLDHYWS